MLAPFFVNLLMLCLSLLFTGWAIDFISGWLQSGQQGASHANRSAIAPASRLKANHLSVCAGCEMHSDWLFSSPMTDRRRDA
jgi:hypothetical protein